MLILRLRSLAAFQASLATQSTRARINSALQNFHRVPESFQNRDPLATLHIRTAEKLQVYV